MRFSISGPGEIWLRWGVLLAAALMFHASTILFGLVNPFPHDFFIHYRWVVEFADAFWDGDLYPRWMARANFGLGEPTMLYYSPLFYYAAAVLRGVTGNAWDAMRLVMVISTVLTGYFGYRLLRSFTGEYTAPAGAICLQWAPLVQMTFNFMSEIPWAVSSSVLAAAIYYTTRPGAFSRLIDLPVAICVALLVMTHVLSAMMLIICFSLAFLPYLRIGARGFAIGRPLYSWVLSVSFGMLLSAFYLFPAILDLKYINPGTYIGALNMWSGFAFPLVTWKLYGLRWFAFQWPVAGVVLLCTAVATGIAMRRPDRSDRRGQALRFLLIAAWAAIFLSSELSIPLWLLPAPLRMLQFPHRFIYIASATGMLAALLVLLERNPTGGRWMRLLSALPLLIGLALSFYIVAKVVLVDGRPVNLSSDDRSLYEGAREYDLRSAGPGWHSYAKGGFERDCRRAGLDCKQLPPTGDHLVFQVNAPKPQLVRLPTFAFPAWRATVDGAAAPLETNQGMVAVMLSQGRHEVALTWRRLPEEIAGLWITLLTAAAALWLGWRQRKVPVPGHGL